MEHVNQITYGIFSAFALILALKSDFEIQSLKITDDQKTFWMKAVIGFLLSNVSFAIGSFGVFIFLWFANLCLVFTLNNVFLLFKALQQPVNKKLIVFSNLLIVIYALVFLSFFIIEVPYGVRYSFAGCTLLIFSLIHLREIIKLTKTDHSVYLKFIAGMLISLIAIIGVRLFTVNEVANVIYVYQEQPLGTVIRIFMALSYFGLFVFISSYFYEKLLLSEEETVAKLNATVSELKAVTAQKKAVKALLEEREQLLSSLVKVQKIAQTGVLSASIAHELSQPLCAVKINAQSMRILIRNQTDPLLGETLNRINSNIDRAAAIIDALKGLFTENIGKGDSVAVDNFVKSFGTIFQSNLKDKSVHLKYELNAPIAIHINVAEFQQVVINLINNALNAFDKMDNADKHIIIKTQQSASSTRISVIDNGPGISDAVGNTIFELTKTTQSTGMGVGLWLSRYIVERHGGTLIYENQPEAGVAFIIELPNR